RISGVWCCLRLASQFNTLATRMSIFIKSSKLACSATFSYLLSSGGRHGCGGDALFVGFD
ncbi:hypothetical protein ACNQUF_12610, partial [Corynebacterium diphtheriae]